VDHASRLGASVVEAYPITDAGAGRRSQRSSGTVGLFSLAGFSMVGSPAARHVVMRRRIG
jgi:hypothetical protein